MIDGLNNLKIATPTIPAAGGATSPGASGASFSDVLKNSIDEVARLQRDASQATQDLLTGRTEDVTGVFAAMEKSDIAFKTLLAIRGKLMDAFDEIKNMPI